MLCPAFIPEVNVLLRKHSLSYWTIMSTGLRSRLDFVVLLDHMVLSQQTGVYIIHIYKAISQESISSGVDKLI